MLNYYYGILWLYLLVCTVVAPATCLFAFLTVAQAAKRQLRAYQKWLVPLAVGAAMNAVGTLLLSIGALLRIDPPTIIEIQTAAYILATIGAIFAFRGFIALWQMVKSLPPYQRPNEIADEPPDSHIWPPPPKSP